MKLTTLLFLASSFVSCVVSAQIQLKFIVNHPGSPPYIYKTTDADNYLGIIPDVLKELIETNQLNIRFVSNSRIRSENALYQGKIDLMMLSHKWLKQPEKLIATIPILQHRSFLYGVEEFSEQFSLKDIKSIRKICTRVGFNYPNLEPYFQQNMLNRIDSSSQVTMLRMLYKGRCDYAIFNENNAISLMISSEFKEKKLYQGKSPISTVPLNIILRPELTKEKRILDLHIKKLMKSGELQRIINHHIQ
ncbi:MAG: transporter substrate-binding domain-containing protein [Colwellia sp.]|nr:transporter substrate-binding domain-containing protein [Colwellia sp.]MCW8865820.1 transporter substrate-binding domain-containing protein [Colwellia sp.]MCW9081782.1 transporter substrate-binding domain-containing protein [Colwellia sp.]